MSLSSVYPHVGQTYIRSSNVISYLDPQLKQYFVVGNSLSNTTTLFDCISLDLILPKTECCTFLPLYQFSS